MNNMYRVIDLEQGSQEWLDFRKGKIGSSSAASIMGKGFKTPLQLFEDIMEDKVTKVNSAMMRGTQMEPEARQYLNDKYGSDLQPIVIQNAKFDWHISSLDGFWKRPDGSVFICEIKCAGKVDHQCALDGKVPEKYLPQLYHILEDLPCVDKILYLSYHPDSQAEIWVSRDEKAMADQLSEELSFFNRLIDCRPPEPTDKDWIEFSKLECTTMADRYAELLNEMKACEEEIKDLKQKIIDEIEGCNRAKIGDLKVQRVIRKGLIDYSKIEALEGLDLEPFRKNPIVSWRLTI